MRPKILLIYTGGTIGMMADSLNGELKPLDFEYIHQHIPEIERLDIDVIPTSIEQPIDSSQMQAQNWVELVTIIEKNHERVDGFVVLHGTDTMAFTASALSFMVQNLGKPIVLTGSQLPIGILRSDGKENLITALEIASKKGIDGKPILKEVAVFFQSKLFRGNRTSKISAHQFDAFDSPNYPLIGVAGVDITFYTDRLLIPKNAAPTFYKKLDTRMGLIKLFPGINLGAYESLFDPNKTRAIIIEAYGAGNGPSDIVFENQLKNYVDRGGVLVTLTQCTSGSVLPGQYASGMLLSAIGAWNGRDLTTETAITKLMWMFGKTNSPISEEFSMSVCGEL